MAAMGSAVHRINSRYPTPSYPPTTSESPNGVPDATAQAINNSRVGDCIHRVIGTPRKDGSSDVTVTAAACGSTYATDKVTMRTNNNANCTSGQWVQTKAYSPPIVLCLSKLR
jgi:hypothetical protein